MKKWEYLTMTKSLKGEDWTLEEMGEQGWELCSVIYNADFSYTFYFKRQKLNDSN
jgi:hypothetical protein